MSNDRLLGQLLGIAAIASLLGGCAKVADSVSADRIVASDPQYFESTGTFKSTQEVNFGNTEDGNPTAAQTIYNCAVGMGKCIGQTPEQARDRVQDLLFRASAHNCAIHEGAIYGGSSWYSTIGDIVAAGLAGSAAIAGGLTGQALAAGAAFATATRVIIEKNVYQSYIAPAIIAEIEKSRRDRYALIISKRNNASYTVDMAIVDAIEYNDECSFYKGVASLAKSAGKTTVNSPVSSQISALLSLRKVYEQRIVEINQSNESTAEKEKQKNIIRERIKKVDDKIDTLTASGSGFLLPINEGS